MPPTGSMPKANWSRTDTVAADSLSRSWITRDRHHSAMAAMMSRVVVLLGLGAFLALVPFSQALGFTDVGPTTQHSRAIEDLASRGIVSGFNNGTFRPDGTVIRQQLAKMIVLAMGFTATEQETYSFNDVPHTGQGLYPYHFVAVAAFNGLVNGYPDASFRPLGQTTRMQLITIVARAAESLLREPPDEWQGLLDSSNPAHGRNTRRAEYSGLLAGLARDLATWDTSKPATRGEVAQLLHNLLVATAYHPPLSITNYGAKGDGVSDDIDAIQACVHAAAHADRGVYIPEGTYLMGAGIWLPTGDATYNNLSITGAGVGKTILTMPQQSGETYMFMAVNLSGLALSDMTFHTPLSAPPGVCAINARGMQDSSLKRIRVENVDYGFKLGSGDQAHGWVIEDLSSFNVGVVTMFLADVSDSSFQNLDFHNRVDTGRGMCLYVERDNHNLTLENLTCRGGSKYTMQLYNGYGTEPSDHITFTNTVIDATRARHALAISGGFAHITFNTLSITQPSTDIGCINFYNPHRVVINDITASGGLSLITCATAPTDYPTDCVIRGGTYAGPEMGSVPGVTVIDVARF